MNALEFIKHPDLINDQSLSRPQETIVKSIYGLPLSREELEIFLELTELPRYREGVEQSEVTALLPRRSGKSSRIAANITIFESCGREIAMSEGAQPVAMIVASEKSRQARIVFKYIKDKLMRSKLLRGMVKSITREEILLTNGVSIQIFPCDQARVRGQGYLVFVADEVSAWRSAGVNPDSDIIDSARPGLEYEHSKLIKISTPGGKIGEVWEDYKDFYSKENDHVLVFGSGGHDTRYFNPSYSQEKLDKMMVRKPSLYETEHLGKFKDSRGLFAPDLIDGLVNNDRPLERPYRKGVDYMGFSDNAGGSGASSYAMCIGHIEAGRIIIDVVRSQPQPFDPDSQTEIYCRLFRSYGVSTVQGDYFAAEWNVQAHRKYGVHYLKCEKAKSEIFLECESLFNCGLIELPPSDTLIHQLKMLVRTPRSGSKDRVDTPARQADDEANACCGVAWMLNVSLNESRLEESVGLSEPVSETEEEKMARESQFWLLGIPKKTTKPDEIDLAEIERETMEGLEEEIRGKKKSSDDIKFIRS
jgi:hypothetical protein